MKSNLPLQAPERAHGHQSFWLWVMCLTGVDYFSTLGYQPSIAFEATGRLAPIATIVLVIVTLTCALPVYRHVVSQSPHGHGSISMLERLFHGWTSKIVVLILLGFAATDFVITKTLSAADAAEHLVHNPFWQNAPEFLQHPMPTTMILLVLLGAMFLRGFREVIIIAVLIVAVYLALNIVVIGSGLVYLLTHPHCMADWFRALNRGDWQLPERPISGSGWGTMIAICLLYFPKLALGLSGFETGASVMPLVRGDAADDPQQPRGRIRNTRRLLATAAIIMSVLLLGSSTVTAMLIPPSELRQPGHAANRALAYLAHGEGPLNINPIFGDVFGTIYDISTVAILWFAGASAMSGLLNLVPRYLPRYGMAPRWASAVRPLVVLFTVINLVVTWIFRASVEAQSGAYATGVMVLMSSAAMAVIVDHWRLRKGRAWLLRVPWNYVLVLLVFVYTTTAIAVEKPEGIRIAGCFIVGILLFSLLSRTRRSMEMRFQQFEFVDNHSRLLWDALRFLEFPVLVPHRPGTRSIAEKEAIIRCTHRLNADEPIVFVEVQLGDPSEFYHSPLVEVTKDEGRFVIRVTRCVSIPHALAAIALDLAKGGKPPEVHFGWSDASPLAANVDFLLFGEGNVPWLVRELILKAESDPMRQPRVVIG